MNVLYLSLLTLGISATNILAIEDGENDRRDVNDASESVDYVNKIPVYVIPNAANAASAFTESKIPVAVISGAYSPAYFNVAPLKDAKQYPKYNFQSPYAYKFAPKATPIHEPSSDEESPAAAHATQPQYVYRYRPKSEYDLSSFATLKPSLPKHQTVSSTNTYAAQAAPTYANADTHGAAHYPTPTTKKYAAYDAENNVQIQYVLKYVPVPYEVAATTAPDLQQYSPNAAALTYITPKPYYLNKESAKKSQAAAVNYPAAESYAPLFDDVSQPLPSFKQIPAATTTKYLQQAKKYVPTSYVLATIGKNSPTHYAATIKHDNTASAADTAAQSYATKLVSIPLPIEKYVTDENKVPAAGIKSVDSGGDYSYVIATNYPSSKYKQSLLATPSNEPESSAIYEYATNGGHHQYNEGYYDKKDVSRSLSNGKNSQTR